MLPLSWYDNKLEVGTDSTQVLVIVFLFSFFVIFSSVDESAFSTEGPAWDWASVIGKPMVRIIEAHGTRGLRSHASVSTRVPHHTARYLKSLRRLQIGRLLCYICRLAESGCVWPIWSGRPWPAGPFAVRPKAGTCSPEATLTRTEAYSLAASCLLRLRPRERGRLW